ncbi:hypothetical protein WPS_28580 [Vulcanimicrobium alpinum]|uniref:Uncharacterized protein n=1 Tax=Vulcanimicrobium alpinum TaxID=3016050 RepID=A0AAN1Y090_UNVUL|nr:hypothetical protein [Vulcanimicrobium alpinum]BDE07582.1 hypothetical protein WPS_28580 [Vulcanimicrobium alpinum]
MQQTTSVAVLATQLAGTDRRALSEAWYHALHVAEPAARAAAPASPRRHAATPSPPNRLDAAAPRARRGEARPRRSVAGVTAREPRTPLAGDRRAPRSELARRVERALGRSAAAVAPAAFSLRLDAGRVHVLIRSDGARTRVVAVCAPALRETVERALAHARFALAGRGIASEAA